MPEDLDRIRAVARRIWEEIIPDADVSAVPQVMHPDCVDHSARPGEPQGAAGLVHAIHWLNGVFSDLRFEIHHVIAEGDTVAVHCSLMGNHDGELMGVAPTNRAIVTPMVQLLRFRGGKVAEHWALHDDLATLRQLGALPPSPQSRPTDETG
jgi:predicted ester cyclase